MKIRFLGLVLAAAMVAATGSAHAALVLTTTGSTTLPSDFNPNYPGFPAGFPGFPGSVNPGVSSISLIANPGEGLTLDAPGKVTFEYLGKEAGFTNSFRSPTSAIGDQLFSTASTAIGAMASVSVGAAGLVPFFLQSSGGGTIGNGNVPFDGMSIAFADLGDGTFLILFNDPGADRDFDDLVVRASVSQVPLPAAAWLLISAILGLVSFARIRRNGAQAA